MDTNNPLFLHVSSSGMANRYHWSKGAKGREKKTFQLSAFGLGGEWITQEAVQGSQIHVYSLKLQAAYFRVTPLF